jgi:hypothetical protein
MIRALALAAALALVACDATPGSLGITGPGAPPPPAPVPDDSTIDSPGIPSQGGGSYGPSIGPAPSNGRYFNYN